MYLNQFSVRVVGGSEVSSGYVEIDHGKQFSISLRNDRSVRCDARVEVDGKDVGTFRLSSHSSILLERPVNDESRFTAYRPNTSEGNAAGVDPSNPDLGLIRVTFTPERYVEVVYRGAVIPEDPWVRRSYTNKSVSNTCGLSAACAATPYSGMGVGLSGHSDQSFHTVAQLDYDFSGQTVIHLRLVFKESGPHPLISTSNPVPPRVS